MAQFHRNINCVDGYLNRCKVCRKLVDAPYIEAHRDDVRERAKAWAAKNRLRAATRARDWAVKHPEQIKANQSKFRSTPHGIELGRAQVRNRKARLRGAEGRHTAKDIAEILRLQRWRCANCHTCLLAGHHIDHREPLSRGGTNDRGNLEALCPPCNMAKSNKLPHVFAQEQGRLL